MRTGLLAVAVAATALAAAVAASPAWALPDNFKGQAAGVASPTPSPDPQPAVPTFVNGLAQAVFSTNPADWYSGEVWVQAPFDSDGDGKLDRIHADFTRPRRGRHRRPEGAGHLRGQPVLRGTAPAVQQLGRRPRARRAAGVAARRRRSGRPATPARRSARSTSRPGCRAASRSCTPSRPAPATPTAARTPAARTRRSAAKAVIDWLNGRAPAYTTRTGDTPAAASWTTGKVGMIGTSYNGTIPVAAATTGVEGLEAIVPISAISDWYDYYRANGMVRAPHRRQPDGQQPLPGRGPRRARRRRLLAPRRGRRRARSAGRRSTTSTAQQDRATGNRSAFWQERNYMKDVEQRQGRDAGRPRQQRLQRHDQERRAVLRGAQGAGRAAQVLLPPGRPRRRAAGRADQLLVHAVPVRRQDNGVENLPRSWVVREAAPARRARRRSPASSRTPRR